MTIEDRLRSAIAARTARVEPSPDALNHIEEKIMDAQRDQNRKRMLIGVGSAAAVIALVVAAVVLTDDDDQGLDVADTTTTEETTTTEATTTTTEPETTETTFAPTADAAQAIWPRVDTSQRFDSPMAVARSFAVDYLGFTDPVVGELRQGDSRSGEVPVLPRADGPETTVLVRQLEDNTWFVIAAETADITIESPEAGATIDCPLQVSGEALAFEGTVNVAIRADAVEEPIGTGFVTGSGSPPAGPYDGQIDCDLSQVGDGTQYGALVLSTSSAEDGQLWTAEVIRIRLR